MPEGSYLPVPLDQPFTYALPETLRHRAGPGGCMPESDPAFPRRRIWTARGRKSGMGTARPGGLPPSCPTLTCWVFYRSRWAALWSASPLAGLWSSICVCLRVRGKVVSAWNKRGECPYCGPARQTDEGSRPTTVDSTESGPLVGRSLRYPGGHGIWRNSPPIWTAVIEVDHRSGRRDPQLCEEWPGGERHAAKREGRHCSEDRRNRSGGRKSRIAVPAPELPLCPSRNAIPWAGRQTAHAPLSRNAGKGK